MIVLLLLLIAVSFWCDSLISRDSLAELHVQVMPDRFLVLLRLVQHHSSNGVRRSPYHFW